ncbi:MAG: hypothetical protein AB8C84_00525 [Oligoflexales bacterium]
MKSNRYKSHDPQGMTLLFLRKSLSAFILLAISVVLAPSQTKSENMLKFSQSPQTRQWKQFMKMKPGDYQMLWDSLSLAGEGFSSWSWEWKIGWVRTCKKKAGYCRELLLLAVEDPAAVVRSASAQKIANLYYQSGDKDFLSILLKEMQKDRNKKLKSSWPVEKQLSLTRRCILGPTIFKKRKQKEMRNVLAKVCRTR